MSRMIDLPPDLPPEWYLLAELNLPRDLASYVRSRLYDAKPQELTLETLLEHLEWLGIAVGTGQEQEQCRVAITKAIAAVQKAIRQQSGPRSLDDDWEA